jgi:hypothetical protein
MINICQTIDCPYYRSEINGFGCQRYSVALHCHLIHPSNDVHKKGFESSTQYVLYQADPNVEALKTENETYLKSDKTYLQDVENIGMDRLPIQYPNRIL